MWNKYNINIFNLLISFVFTFNQITFAFAENKCGALFTRGSLVASQKNEEPVKEIEKKQKEDEYNPSELEKYIQDAFKESQVRAMERLMPWAEVLRPYSFRADIYQKIIGESHSNIKFERDIEAEQLKIYLTLNLRDKAIGILKDRFERFEMSYYKIVKHYFNISNNTGNKKEILTDTELSKFKMDYAREFEFYLEMKEILNNLIKINKDVATEVEKGKAEAAEEVLKNLGAASLFNRKDLTSIGGAPSKNKIKNIAYRDPEIRENKVALMAKDQFKHAIYVGVRTFLASKDLQTWLLKRQNRYSRFIFSTLLFSNYDQLSVKKNIPFMLPYNKLFESLPEGQSRKDFIYESFFKIASETNHMDNFLETYARMTVYFPIWLKIKELAFEKANEAKTKYGDSRYYEADHRVVFFNKIVAAEIVAHKKNKSLSPFQKLSPLDYIIRGIVIAIASSTSFVVVTDYTFEDLAEEVAKTVAGLEIKLKDEKKDKPKTDKPEKPPTLKKEDDRFGFKLLRDWYAFLDAFTNFSKDLEQLSEPHESNEGQGGNSGGAIEGNHKNNNGKDKGEKGKRTEVDGGSAGTTTEEVSASGGDLAIKPQ